MKRYLYIIIAVVVVVVLGLVGWLIFSKGSSSPAAGVTGSTGSLPQTGNQSLPGSGSTGSGGNGGTTGTGGASAGNPSSGTSGGPGTATQFGVVSGEPVLDYFVDTHGNTTVAEPDGKIAQIVNGQVNYLNSAEIQNVISASFSYDGGKVLVNFGDPGNPQTSIFDIATKAWTPLPVGIISPVWSPIDYRIAYFEKNADGTETLATLDVSKATNKPVALSTLHIEDVFLSWPNKTQIAIQDKPSMYTEGSVWFFDLLKKTLTPVVVDKAGLETTWSDTTSTVGLVFSSATGGTGGSLELQYPSGTPQSITFLTLPSKCMFDYMTQATSSLAQATGATSTASSTPAQNSGSFLGLYCAIPHSALQLAGAKLPDAYEQLAVFTSDDFYMINTESGVLQPVFVPDQALDATDLKLFNNTLLFINRYDQKLYAISLAPQS